MIIRITRRGITVQVGRIKLALQASVTRLPSAEQRLEQAKWAEAARQSRMRDQGILVENNHGFSS